MIDGFRYILGGVVKTFFFKFTRLNNLQEKKSLRVKRVKLVKQFVC